MEFTPYIIKVYYSFWGGLTVSMSFIHTFATIFPEKSLTLHLLIAHKSVHLA